MCKLVCHCLNVQINSKSDPTILDSSAVETIKCQVSGYGEAFKLFFGLKLAEVTLNLEGIHVVYPRLLISHSSHDWVVHRCINCGDYTHAMKTKDSGHVVVFADLLGESTIDSLVNSEDYSPVYKIVLKSISENTPVSAIDLMSTDLRDELQSIQKQLNSYLVQEETAMEERIRMFEDKEREKYADLQSKARIQKNIIMSRILSAVYKNVSESLSDAINEDPAEDSTDILAQSPLGSQITFTAKVSADRLSGDVDDRTFPVIGDDNYDDDDDIVPPLPRPPISRSNSNKRQSESSPVIVSKDFHCGPVATDDIFQFDPTLQDDPNQPFSESDEEVDDTDDSSHADDGLDRRGAQNILGGSRSRSGQTGYSTSVPIDVPAWMVGGFGRLQQNQNDDEVDDTVPRDAESMAASIKALARSVHGNTSEIFGELPKPPTRARVVSARTARS